MYSINDDVREASHSVIVIKGNHNFKVSMQSNLFY